MKRFKELRTQMFELAEEYSEGGGFGYDPTLTSKGRDALDKVRPVDYNKEDDLERINAFISAFTSRSYLDPKSALYVLRAKMNLANVDFDLTRATELETNKEYDFPLKRFGGTFGTSPTHNLSQGFEETNGFDGRNFVLTVTVQSSGGDNKKAPYYIQARIVEK